MLPSHTDSIEKQYLPLQYHYLTLIWNMWSWRYRTFKNKFTLLSGQMTLLASFWQMHISFYSYIKSYWLPNSLYSTTINQWTSNLEIKSGLNTAWARSPTELMKPTHNPSHRSAVVGFNSPFSLFLSWGGSGLDTAHIYKVTMMLWSKKNHTSRWTEPFI